MHSKKESRVAVITGSSRGIGRGIALELAKLGYKIVIHSRTGGHAAQATRQAVLDAGAADAICLEADLADIDQSKSLACRVFDHFGYCNIWVNNAGIAPDIRLDLLETSAESWDKVLSTNLKGPFFLTQTVANLMIKHNLLRKTTHPAHIVFITSISSTVASIERGEYCVSKAGLSMVAQLFACRLAGLGVVVTEIRPGIMATDMTSGVKEKYDRLIAQGLVPEGRWGTPEDVGKIVAAIARGDLNFSTGAVVTVDGGLTIPRL